MPTNVAGLPSKVPIQQEARHQQEYSVGSQLTSYYNYTFSHARRYHGSQSVFVLMRSVGACVWTRVAPIVRSAIGIRPIKGSLWWCLKLLNNTGLHNSNIVVESEGEGYCRFGPSFCWRRTVGTLSAAFASRRCHMVGQTQRLTIPQAIIRLAIGISRYLLDYIRLSEQQ